MGMKVIVIYVMLVPILVAWVFGFINVCRFVWYGMEVKSFLDDKYRKRYGIKLNAYPEVTIHEVKIQFKEGTHEYCVAMKHVTAFERGKKSFLYFAGSCLVLVLVSYLVEQVTA